MLRIIHIPKKLDKKRGAEFIERLDFVNWVFVDWTEGAELKGDLIWIMYSPKDRNYQYNLPNKYFTAQANKIPVMVSEGTYLASRVRKSKAGFVVKYDFDSIKLFLENYNRFLNGCQFSDNDVEGNKLRLRKLFDEKL